MSQSRKTKKRNVSVMRVKPGPGLSALRIAILAFSLCVPLLVLVWHLAHLQVVPGQEKGFAFLQKQGEARTIRQERINAYRGVIKDRNGEILAVSTPVLSIYANPQRLDMSRLTELAKAIGESPKKLALKISRYADKQFVYLKRQMPPQEAQVILDLKIQGVHSEQAYQRFYPAGEVAAHIVGFTDIDEQGQEGMELALDQVLAGEPGAKRVLKDLKGRVVKDLGVETAASSGDDVQLSIDLRLQYLAYRELKNAVASQNAKSGSIVVMDVNSGEVLAMANQPSYNPNNRNVLNPSQLRNRAITDLIEPGSTIKPLTVLAALETGRYQPSTIIDTNPGYYRVPGKTYTDFKNYGEIDLATVIKKSSQVGMSKIAMDIDPEIIRGMFFRFGLGQATGVGFPGEAFGLLPERRKWHPTERASLAFGYGLNVTPLQLAQAYSAIASGGVLRPASLFKQEKIPEGVRIIQQKHASQVLAMLKTVPEKGGTATRAQISAYPVAGKTGTAHKIGENGYADDKYVALFAGMAPAHDPQLVTVVVINEPPAEHYYGGEAAAPVFARVVESSLKLLSVPPSNIEVAVH